MNLFEKIQEIRVRLQEEPIKMTGKNTYAGYDYFELDDFLKPLNRLMQEYKMVAIPSFAQDVATLTAINCEKPDEVFIITSPMGSAQLKGCHEVQNIGAVETYQRRYLYQAMFDISESDALNKTHGKEDNAKTQKPPQNSPAKPFPEVSKDDNITTIKQSLKGTNWTIDQAEQVSIKCFGRYINELNVQQLKSLILRIEEAKKNG
jgi:hypothetical protein